VFVIAPSGDLVKMSSIIGDLPNIGVMYLAAIVEKTGREAIIINKFNESPRLLTLVNEILSHQPDLIGFTLFDSNTEGTHSLLKALRHTYTGPIVIGGYTATAHGSEILTAWSGLVSYILCREAEETLPQFLEYLEGTRAVSQVGNLIYRDDTIRVNAEYPPTDIKTIPWPKREWGEKWQVQPLLTSRGCRSRCSFCSSHTFISSFAKGQVRKRPVSDVVDELAFCVENQRRIFCFYDDDFNISTTEDRLWVERFCTEIRSRNLDITYYLEMRICDVLNNRDLLAALIQSGLAFISLGMESLLPRQLTLYKKSHTAEQVYQALEILKSLDVYYQTNVIFWDPFITIAEACQHLDLLEGIGIHEQITSANFSWFATSIIARKGTGIHELLKEKGLLVPHKELFYRYDYAFQDEAVRLFHDHFFPVFMSSTFGKRIPHVWLKMIQLKAFHKEEKIKSYANYARTVSALEYAYFKAFLNAYARITQSSPLSDIKACFTEKMGELDAEYGAQLREYSGIKPV